MFPALFPSVTFSPLYHLRAHHCLATDPGWEHTIPLLLEHSYQWGDLGNTPRLHKVPTPVQGIWRESGQAKERGQSKAAIKNSSQSDRGVSYRRLKKTLCLHFHTLHFVL